MGSMVSRSSARRSVRPASFGSFEGFDLGQHGTGKFVGNAVRVHGDQADLALVLRVAERFDDARLRHAQAARAGEIVAHEIAVLGVALVARRDRPFLQLLAVDGIDDAAFGAGAEDAELAALLLGQALDRLRLVAVAEHVHVFQARDAWPGCGRPGRAPARRRVPPSRGWRGRARGGARLRCGSQTAGSPINSPSASRATISSTATGGILPRSLKPLRLPLSRPSSAISVSSCFSATRSLPCDRERARNLALARRDARILDELEDLVLGGQPRAAGFLRFAGHRACVPTPRLRGCRRLSWPCLSPSLFGRGRLGVVASWP